MPNKQKTTSKQATNQPTEKTSKKQRLKLNSPLTVQR